MMIRSQLKDKQTTATANSKNNIKRKNSVSFLDRFFGPKSKRARTDSANNNDNKNMKDESTNKKTKKPSLDKARRKEVKQRLNEEASKDIRPLAVGTLAMMASALSNQGELHSLCCR